MLSDDKMIMNQKCGKFMKKGQSVGTSSKYHSPGQHSPEASSGKHLTFLDIHVQERQFQTAINH